MTAKAISHFQADHILTRFVFPPLLGTPVLGARIGGIPELIEEGITGMTFASKNVEDLKVKIQKMFASTFNYPEIAQKSQEKYNAEKYYNELMKIYQ